MSIGLSVRREYCGKTAECIPMSFGVVSGIRRGMGALDRGGGRRRGRANFGVNLGRPIVTNGDSIAQLCESDALFPNYYEEVFLTVRKATF